LPLDSDSFAADFFRRTPIPTVLFDGSLRVGQVSDSYLEVSGGCSADEVLGLHADAFFDHKVTLPSLGSARKALREALDTRRPYELDEVQPNGSAWTIRVVPIFRHGALQYTQMELKDTTEERQRQLELEERLYTNETFRILVETVKDYAIFMLDPNGNVATWNAGAQVFKGKTFPDMRRLPAWTCALLAL
jgi:osomolarity two-component system sensor histidine kinase TcsA